MTKIRASSLSELFDCPSRWEARNLLGMRLPSSGAAQLGTAIHAGCAVYDRSVLVGTGLSISDSAAAVVDEIASPRGDVDWASDDVDQRMAAQIGLALHKKYCEQISPTAGYCGIEVECGSLEIRELDITLTGTTDRIRRVDGGIAISDLKSGKNAVKADGSVDTAKHSAQLAVYELLAEQSTGLGIAAPARIVGLQTGKTDKAQRVAVGECSTTRSILLGDPESPGLLQHASALLKSGLFYGNPRSQLCGAKYCPRYSTCKFRR